MKAVGYTRVSTGQQADEGTSLEVQRDKIAAYCDLHDYELVDTYEDAGVSGKTIDRPGLQGALEALESGEADILVVYKINRLSRHVGDMQTLLDDYFGETGGYDVAAVTESMDTTTATGRMVLNILLSVDQGERERIAERTREALAMKRKRGEYTGGEAPYGYRVSRDGTTLEEDPEEQKVLDAMLQYRDAGLSLRETAKRLAERGMYSRSGNRFDPKSISNIEDREAS